MRNNIANRQVICDVLLEAGRSDKEIIVLCSDSRGSASLTAFAEELPGQFVEIGIAEQNLVSVSAGLASCGKKVFAASPACFLTTRSLEQIKIDVAYSDTNVKLIGISGGVSYGALGMSHHSLQDIAAVASIPNMRVYIPCDRHRTKNLFKHLINDKKPAYIRVGRNPVEDIYNEETDFDPDKAKVLRTGGSVLIIACGEPVKPAADAASLLEADGIGSTVLDICCVKPLDSETVLRYAKDSELIITAEEHSEIGGLGSMVSRLIAANCPKRVYNIALPDEPAIAGSSQEIFEHYGLTASNIYRTAKEFLRL